MKFEDWFYCCLIVAVFFFLLGNGIGRFHNDLKSRCDKCGKIVKASTIACVPTLENEFVLLCKDCHKCMQFQNTKAEKFIK